MTREAHYRELCRFIKRISAENQDAPVESSEIFIYEAYISVAKKLYPERPDIGNIVFVFEIFSGKKNQFVLKHANTLKHLIDGESVAITEEITFPEDAPEHIQQDFAEMQNAIALKMVKTVLLLAGSIAESLLINRHYDSTGRGPGLKDLVNEAKKAENKGFLSEDTIQDLSMMINYRDLIHPRAAIRNKLMLDESRIEKALITLKLLCADLGKGGRYATK